MKLGITLLSIVVILASYFYFSNSYMLSREAKEAYHKKEYQKAYDLSSKSLEENPYNKSAFGIKSQSKQRLEIEKFLNKAKINYKRATQILGQGKLTPKEFLELQWICDAFLEDLRILTFTNKPTKAENTQIKEFQEWFISLQKQLQNAKRSEKTKS